MTSFMISVVPSKMDWERDPSWRQLTEDLVHHLGALGERRTDLVAVDRLCRGRAIMADYQGDVSTDTPLADMTGAKVCLSSRGAQSSPRPVSW